MLADFFLLLLECTGVLSLSMSEQLITSYTLYEYDVLAWVSVRTASVNQETQHICLSTNQE